MSAHGSRDSLKGVPDRGGALAVKDPTAGVRVARDRVGYPRCVLRTEVFAALMLERTDYLDMSNDEGVLSGVPLDWA